MFSANHVNQDIGREKKGTYYDREYFENPNLSGYIDGYQYEIYKAYFDNIAKFIVEKFQPESVLDIGCAKGYLVKSFLDLGINAYGVDISAYAINNSLPEVRSRLKLCDIEQEKLPFNDDSFDVVIMTEVIEHLKKIDFAMEEIKRVLKQNGIVYLTTPTPKEAIMLPNHSDPTHINVHDADFWREFFKECGFDCEILPYIKSPEAKDVIEMLNPEKNRFLQSKMGELLVKWLSNLILYFRSAAKLNNLILKLCFAIKCAEYEMVRIRVILKNLKNKK